MKSRNKVKTKLLFYVGLIMATALVINVMLVDVSALAVVEPSDLRENAPKQVLILHSSDYGLPWQLGINKAIYTLFGANTDIKTELHVEYTGLAQNSDNAFEQKLLDLYRYKYKDRELDLIITVSTAPTYFRIKHREELFQGVPTVFISSKKEVERDIENAYLRPNTTGLVSKIDIKGTLDTALKLHPDTQRVAVISGDSKMDRFHEEKVWHVFKNYENRLEFIDLTSLPMTKILDEVARLPEHTIVFYVLTLKDGVGEVFVPREILPRISQASNAPVYGLWDALLGGGLVGGHLSSAEVTGTKVAELGLRILSGEKPGNIPVINGGHAYMYDWRQLRRWKIRESVLPAGSVVRYKEFSFWELYTWHIIGVVVVLLLEALLIGILFVQRSRLRHTETALRESHNNLELRVRARTDELIQANQNLQTEVAERKQTEEQRNELEAQLRQKHKMEAVGYMAGGMAHNFNNNLGIILGNVELAQLKQPRNSDVIPLLENAKIAVRRSRDLVQNIITYSRQGIQQKAPMQLTTITDETIGLLRSTLPTTVALQTLYGSDCNATLINADASQVQECLINLCNNAIQAMNEQGELKIQLEPVELTQQEIPAQYDCLFGRYAKLSVQDSGCGMPAEMLDKIFDPFYTTKEAYEGAGMGLATVQGIVAQHGGFIKVISVLNQGTTFDLYFPIIEQTHIDDPTVENTTLPRGIERILFVDDDEMLASLGEKLLTGMGYQVVVMTESTEALKMFAVNAEHFALVITDQTMPQLSGKDLIQELKKIKPDIPTILCTGYSSKINKEDAKELGISAFMMKPLDLTQLAQTVRRVLDGVEVE